MIALYLHDNRREHVDRARALLAAFPSGATVVSARPRPMDWPACWDQLPDDSPSTWGRWLDDAGCAAVVVDGPPEFVDAATARRVRTAVLAEPGGGDDGDRGPAYAAADAILAPWAPLGLDDGWPSAWRERTIHIGAVGHRAAEAVRAGTLNPTVRSAGGRWHCVVLSSTGGGLGPRERWAAGIETPAWRWTYAQEREALEEGPLWSGLARCEVVVGAPTSTTIATVAACRVPALLVMPSRPSRAQEFLADVAARTAPVVVIENWPRPGEWRFLLDRVRSLDGKDWESWAPGAGLADAIAFLTEGRAAADEPVLLSPA